MTLLFDIGIVIIFATFISYFARILKQPLIVAYVIAGVIIGPIGFGLINNFEDINTLAELGIAFLLFTVGLEIDFNKLRHVGKPVIVGALAQMGILFGVGILVSNLLGFSHVVGVYIGLLVAFSSTMIVTKLLIDKNELKSLHGRLMIGILIIQDIAVVLLLPLLTNTSGQFSVEFLGDVVIKGVGLFAIAIVLNKFIFPKILDFAAEMREVLFLTAISIVFAFIGFSSILGFSIVIGAFIAGIALGNFPYNLEIVGETRALMNFFSIIFFTSLGMSLSLAVIHGLLVPFLVLLAIVMLIKPVVLAFIYFFLGYGTRTSSVVGIGLGQASEFSFIIASQGLLLGQLTQEMYSLLVSVVVVSMVLTPYLMKTKDRFYKIYSMFGSSFVKKHAHRNIKKMEASPGSRLKNHTIILGCDVMGGEIVKYLKKGRRGFMVVDHNPEKIHEMKNRGIFCVYGNIDHEDLLKRLSIKRAKNMVITIPDEDVTEFVIKKSKQINKKIKIVARAYNNDSAKRLKLSGASSVVLPEYVSGKKMVQELKKIS